MPTKCWQKTTTLSSVLWQTNLKWLHCSIQSAPRQSLSLHALLQTGSTSGPMCSLFGWWGFLPVVRSEAYHWLSFVPCGRDMLGTQFAYERMIYIKSNLVDYGQTAFGSAIWWNMLWGTKTNNWSITNVGGIEEYSQGEPTEWWVATIFEWRLQAVLDEVPSKILSDDRGN